VLPNDKTVWDLVPYWIYLSYYFCCLPFQGVYFLLLCLNEWQAVADKLVQQQRIFPKTFKFKSQLFSSLLKISFSFGCWYLCSYSNQNLFNICFFLKKLATISLHRAFYGTKYWICWKIALMNLTLFRRLIMHHLRFQSWISCRMTFCEIIILNVL
jgi:hypothetical protein